MAEQAPDPEFGRWLATIARAAFVSGFRTAFVVAAVVVLLAAAMVHRFGPSEARDRRRTSHHGDADGRSGLAFMVPQRSWRPAFPQRI